MDSRKPGLSNGIAKQEGFPTSGETSANAGALPAQRAQAPYEQNRAQTNMPQPTAKPPVGGGTLNGGAVQGAQYKTQAQNMSPGVASFISIPKGISAQPAGFSAPQPSIPGATKMQMQMQQQPQYFGPGGSGMPGQAGLPQGQQSAQPQNANAQQMQSAPQAQGAAAQQSNAQAMQPQAEQVGNLPTFAPVPVIANPPSNNQPPPSPNVQPSPAPTPTADPANYDYFAEMQKMGQYYDIGGQYDLNQRSLAAETARQQNMQAWAQNQLSGRGGTAGQAQQNYLNTLAELQSGTARSQLAQQAHQTELANRLAFNKQVADAKMQVIKLANDINLKLSDADYNKAAFEIVNAYNSGKNVSPGTVLEAALKGTGNKTPPPSTGSTGTNNLAKPTQGGSFASSFDPNAISQEYEQRANKILNWAKTGKGSSLTELFDSLSKMSDAELKDFTSNNKDAYGKVMSYLLTNDKTKAMEIANRVKALLS